MMKKERETPPKQDKARKSMLHHATITLNTNQASAAATDPKQAQTPPNDQLSSARSSLTGSSTKGTKVVVVDIDTSTSGATLQSASSRRVKQSKKRGGKTVVTT